MVTLVPLPDSTQKQEPKYKRPPGCQAKPGSHTLHFSRLSPYEIVTDQFRDAGVLVQSAIAVRPSNPSFVDQPSRLQLMPLGKQSQLRLILQQRFTAIELHLRGYRDFRIDVLDHDGHSLTTAIVHRQRQENHHRAPEEAVTIDTARAAQLVVSSSTAFVLHDICLHPR